MRRTLLCTLPLFALFLLAGCGPGGSTVTGQVNYGTSKPAEGDKISLTISDGKNTYSAEPDANGMFTFEKVPDGSYTVTVIQYKTTPAGEPKSGKQASGPGAPDTKTYPDNFKVPGGPYTIDMAKITPTKK